jgi:hypothetical protein
MEVRRSERRWVANREPAGRVVVHERVRVHGDGKRRYRSVAAEQRPVCRHRDREAPGRGIDPHRAVDRAVLTARPYRPLRRPPAVVAAGVALEHLLGEAGVVAAHVCRRGRGRRDGRTGRRRRGAGRGRSSGCAGRRRTSAGLALGRAARADEKHSEQHDRVASVETLRHEPPSGFDRGRAYR